MVDYYSGYDQEEMYDHDIHGKECTKMWSDPSNLVKNVNDECAYIMKNHYILSEVLLFEIKLALMLFTCSIRVVTNTLCLQKMIWVDGSKDEFWRPVITR